MCQVQGLESPLNAAVSEGLSGDLDSLPIPTSSKPASLMILPKACLSLGDSYSPTRIQLNLH